MKNGELFFRLILFNLIIIVTTGAAIFSSDVTGSMKTTAIILYIFVIILMAFLDIILYIKNKLDKLEDKYGINR